MSDSHTFQLQRFYYGTLVDQANRTSGVPGVIGRTPGVTAEHIADCVKSARLAPPHLKETSDDLPGAIGLFRGEASEFIIAKAQRNQAGYVQVLYVLTPIEPLRVLGGNILAFRSLAMADMPSFRGIKEDLQLYELHIPGAPSRDSQIDTLLDLLTFCQDSSKSIEGILAGVVQGWPLAIVNSPSSTDLRLRFIQGLLSLLPVPARVGITFVTHVEDAAGCPAQIKFLSGDARPAKHIIYDWQGGNLLTPPPADSYSRYMLAQLRLDPSLVVEQTEQLSRTTVWRAMHRENLGRALSWVSRRAAIDQTVLEGQPADRDTVAAILREDPTLTDELRLAYARHLLAFTLALNDPEAADVIPTIAVSSHDVAEMVTDQLNSAIAGGQATIVHRLIERWLLRIPEASALSWHAVLHDAVRQEMRQLVDTGQAKQSLQLLDTIRVAHAKLRMHDVLPDLVKIAQPAAQQHAPLAKALFLIAVETLPAGELHRLLTEEQFSKHLPPETRTALQFLQPEPRHAAPALVLDHGARVFGDGHRMLVLARLVEWAMYLQRSELVTTTGLQALLVMAQSPEAHRFETVIQHVVDDFSQADVIQVLDPPGPRVLVQLLLHIGAYDQAVGLLEFYQNTVFGPQRLEQFTALAGEVFRLTPLAAPVMDDALGHLEGSQIRPEPRAMIYCCALMNQQWPAETGLAARRLTSMLFNDHHLIHTIGHDNALKLLHLHARPRNALDTLRVAAALIDHTLDMGNQGAVLISSMWPHITWDSSVTDASLELLRRYIRGIPANTIPDLIGFFERELGADIADKIRATYLMQRVMGSRDLLEFASDIHTASRLLIDIATAYHADKELPPNHRLRRELDTMTGGLNKQERQRVAQNILDITRHILDLGQHRSRSTDQVSVEKLLVRQQTTPLNGVDLMRMLGGHFADGKPIDLQLSREAMAHIFGSRSAAMFLRETDVIARLLRALVEAFTNIPPGPRPSSKAFVSEFASLWSSLSLYNQRRIRDQFAADAQHLADVISIMADRGSDRVLQDTGLGRQLATGQRQPRTALETLRWIHGYFARMHLRTRS